MSSAELTEPVRDFVERHVATLDHVAILLMLRDQAGAADSPSALAERNRLDRSVVDRVLADLAASGFLEQDRQSFRYAPPAELRHAVDELALAYRTMPVTLIRAIYARGARQL